MFICYQVIIKLKVLPKLNIYLVPYYMKFSRHVNFAIWRVAYFATPYFHDFAKILRKFCILTHFNFAFLSETQFISLSMLFYMSLKIWSNNLINNVQINRNAADYVNSNKKDVLTASRRHGMYLPMLECKSRYYWSIDLNIHYIKYSFLLTPRKKMLPFSCTTDAV